MGEHVTVIRSVSAVHLASSSHTKKVLLNPIDHWMKPVTYHKRVLFFKTDGDDTVMSTVADRLKASLSETLVHFYPFAGRVKVRDDDGVLELVCNGEGAQFAEATIDAKLDDIKEFQPSPFFSELAQTPGYDLVYPWKLDYPLLFVQVTIFQQGGFSVGVTFSHQIADGTSFWQFVRSWAEVARGKPISAYPQYIYGSLHARGCASGGSKDSDYIDSSYTFIDAKELLLLGSSAPLESKLFHFSAKAISDLKLLAGESSKGRPFTTFEVVCAHIWQRGTVAREVEDNAESKLFIAINLRGRISSYPEHYFGNGAIFTAAITPAGALKVASLSDVATLIQKAVADFTEEKIHALLGMLSDDMFNQEKKLFVRLDFDRDMIVRSSPRLRMYDTDFGWGRPVAVTFDIKCNHHGAVLLDSGREEGSLDITLPLTPKAVGRLLRDQTFFPNKRTELES